MTDIGLLAQEFGRHFGGTAQFFRAPGRVNLIGEFTDYNAGFVLPAAIPFYTTVGVAARSGGRLRVHSTNLKETREINLNLLRVPGARPSGRHWSDYVAGVAWALEAHGVILDGADLLIHGEVPLGAGLSSSAALEVAVVLALASLADVALDGFAVAKIAQRAENDYVGMQCGIMDPFTSVFGKAGHALKIDCRSLTHELVPLGRVTEGGAPARIVICNSEVRHQLAGSEYNRRRLECEEGLRSLKRFAPNMEALRDVRPAFLVEHQADLDPVIYRRCLHVVTENVRVMAAAAALRQGKLEQFGALMAESHRSLQKDFEVSCPELDLLVELAGAMEGVYGARMTGGGFGGCTVNLVRLDQVFQFKALMAARYTAKTGVAPEIYVCEAAEGAGAAPVEQAWPAGQAAVRRADREE